MMIELNSQQAKYLRGLAHSLKPVVLVGKGGITEDVVAAVDAALDAHELIKVKFIEARDKAQKRAMCSDICQSAHCGQAGLIGHTAILYRPAAKVSKRRIALP